MKSKTTKTRKGETTRRSTTRAGATTSVATTRHKMARVAPTAERGAPAAPASTDDTVATAAQTARPTKGANILALIKRPEGATMTELMGASGWQRHSIRGFLSVAAKKHGFTITSAKNAAGERVYRAVAMAVSEARG